MIPHQEAINVLWLGTKMEDSFFEASAQIREDIYKRISQVTDQVPHKKLRDIISQRNKTSSFLKGTISYLIHEGIGGNLSNGDKVELATGIEVLCSSGAIFDNAIDNHEERNGETTFLKEYGIWMQVAASQYVLHHGLKILFPFMHTYTQRFSHMYSIDEAVVGMVSMDIERSRNLREQIEITEMSNGRFAEVPLVIAATTGTDDETIIENISKYGFNLGTALGIYEEVRDMLGKHGRRRATEIERGRFAIPLHIANEREYPRMENYVGRVISDDEYAEMIKFLIRSDSIRETQKLVTGYFDLAENSLYVAVSSDCYNKLNDLRTSVSSEFEKIISEVEREYG